MSLTLFFLELELDRKSFCWDGIEKYARSSLFLPVHLQLQQCIPAILLPGLASEIRAIRFIYIFMPILSVANLVAMSSLLYYYSSFSAYNINLSRYLRNGF
ncbi:hypothetical protein BDA96_01G396300 [Sorghum bicolor]|uniref:Uncharacterized protein n=2 Tax=Sorghum bicolor TaxID=4558 RepID=A0A1B6QN86_SORBI|nr:hypothetical protein BDA96_01G396300 [Sorghum bicolor]KXG39380.1 hypothetical protein SORBI_3001G372200 [Sorghum bicolor]KXG39381.1 hypothetical protein SORBI_3001G372200 [Sorghum bicolor]